MTRSLAAVLASAIQAEKRCFENPKSTWFTKWEHLIDYLVGSKMPSGGGFDNGTKLIRRGCTDQKLVFETSFHHMDENGFYDGWTHHRVVVHATFDGLRISVSGSQRNEIREHIAEGFDVALSEVCTNDEVNAIHNKYDSFKV